MSVSIRPLVPADEAAWAELYRGYRDFYAEPDDDAKVAAAWRMLLDPADGCEGLVALEASGALVGLANWREFGDPLAAEHALFLDDLYVRPDRRGSGVGEALIAHLADIARERGHHLVRWITDPANSTARRLYDRIATATPWVTYDFEV